MARVIGIVPLGIGLTVLTFAWSQSFDGGFGNIPIFFRLFVSFIALFFILIGGGIVFAGSKGGQSALINQALDLQQQLQEGLKARGMTLPGEQTQGPPMTSEGYVCPSCNAPIGNNADVSPHGDVKCGHCGRWFNVHG
jgi:hypothetical protein